MLCLVYFRDGKLVRWGKYNLFDLQRIIQHILDGAFDGAINDFYLVDYKDRVARLADIVQRSGMHKRTQKEKDIGILTGDFTGVFKKK